MKAPSRRSQVRGAEAVLQGLLRTPKTRTGLIAAVATKSISKHFVYGWLAEQVRAGAVAQLKSTRPATYQRSTHVVTELPTAGVYPAWLEPRTLPAVVSRKVYFDGLDPLKTQKEN